MSVRLSLAVLVLSGAVLAPLVAAAQTFPDRPVRILVGQQPGGPTDTLTRMVANHLKDALGQPVVVENKPGAGTNLAADTMLKSKADGHVLFVGGLGPFTVNDVLYSNLPFSPEKDFALIALLARTPHVLAISPTLPAASLAEFVGYVKANAGKTNYGSPGVGTAPHFASVMFMARAGIESAHVPYRGGPTMMDAVAKGEVQWALDAPLSVMPPSRDGRVRPIAVSAPQRSPQFPDVPTFVELGMPEVTIYAWFALAAPAGTPEPVVARLNAETIRALGTPEAQQRLANLGFESPALTPAQVAGFAAEERKRLSVIARQNNMKVE
jgi:tripartite-type tricarboxylate transporter receptor subunit TctC